MFELADHSESNFSKPADPALVALAGEKMVVAMASIGHKPCVTIDFSICL